MYESRTLFASAAEAEAFARQAITAEQGRRSADVADIIDDLTSFRTANPTPAEQVAAANRPTETPADQVEAWLGQLGRKVEIVDVTDELRLAAQTWAQAWTGTFEFMVDMHVAATGRKGLSFGQAKGTLNCWRADINRRAQTAAENTAGRTPVTEPGYYLHDETVYLVQSNKANTNIYAKRLVLPREGSGQRARWEYASGAIRILDASEGLTVEDAARLGHLHGYCFCCGKRLDKPRASRRVSARCVSRSWPDGNSSRDSGDRQRTGSPRLDKRT